MKALWIRVEAHDVDSREISRFAAALGLSKVTALGHCTVLAGALAEQTDDGRIDLLTDDEIEEWGRWTGRRGKFSAAVREHLQGQDGTFRDWLETMGQLVERRAKDRKRKELARQKRLEGRESVPRSVRGQSTEIPGNVRGSSTVTGRDGTGRRDTASTNPRELERERSFSETLSHAHASSPDLTAPLRALSLDTMLQELAPHPRGFLEAFYPRRTRPEQDRARDVAIQLVALQRGESVPDHRRQPVRAYSPDRLATKCREVQAAPPRDGNAAIAVLLIKLGDTTDVQEAWAADEKAKFAGPIADSRVLDLIQGVAKARTLPDKAPPKPKAHP